MARYIDADKLIAHLKDEIKGCEPPFGSRANGKSIAYGTKLGLKSAISFAETLATADVVPKRELNRYKMCSSKEDYQNKVARLRERELAREIFEELHQKRNELWNKGNYTMFECWCKAEEEVKKKYTEDANE